MSSGDTAARRLIGTLLALTVAAGPAGEARANENTSAVTEAGDILQFALPGIAGVASLFEPQEGFEGTKQFTASFATSMATVQILKPLTNKTRPDNADGASFPSGHTAAAFSGASFLQTRYGPWAGIPAYAAAIFTGASRVDGQKHFLDDVIAGAGISMLSNWYWTKPYPQPFTLLPTSIEGGPGIALHVTDVFWSDAVAKSAAAPRRTAACVERNRCEQAEAEEPPERAIIKPFKPRYRFSLEFGPVWMGQNEVQAPPPNSTFIDFREIGVDVNPTISALLNFEFFLDDNQKLLVGLWPYEVRSRQTLTQDVSFGGNVYDTGTETTAGALFYDYYLAYQYDVHVTEEFRIGAGLGITIQDLEYSVENSDGSNRAEVSRVVVFPQPYLGVGYDITETVEIFGDAEGMAYATDSTAAAGVGVRWHLNPNWDVGLAYRMLYRDVDSAGLRSKLLAHGALVSFGYSFGNRA